MQAREKQLEVVRIVERTRKLLSIIFAFEFFYGPPRRTRRDLTRRLECGAELVRLQARRGRLKQEAEEVCY